MENEVQIKTPAVGIKKLGIVTSCADDWGGCEELWARSIPGLQKNGIDVIVYKKKINFTHPEFISLKEKKVSLKELDPLISKGKENVRKVKRIITQQFLNNKNNGHSINIVLESFKKALMSDKPDLMIIAQSINFDGLQFANECLKLNIPYLLIIQKAVDFYWPQLHERAFMKECFLKAEKCFFVSKHNKRLTEEQFGIRIPNSVILSNPIKIHTKFIPFPTPSPVYKLVCIGRLFILDKGQDILLRILAKPKWRSRPVKVSFAGTGVDEQGLKEMAKLLNVKNIEFLGQVTGIEKLWAEHHALVLPSRSEGLPLCLLEAMAAGRPAIVSNAGGNKELVIDNITGFIAEANETAFEEAMERAWKRRDHWLSMGQKANEYISAHAGISPEIEFVNHIKSYYDQ